MKLNALINSDKGNTLVIELPQSPYDIYEKLCSVGITKPPNRIRLKDEDGDAVRVKLYGEDDLGKHLSLLLSENNTLADANTLAFVVDSADKRIKNDLEQAIIQDRYSSPEELFADIKQMLFEAGPVTQVFYFPLSGVVYEYDEEYDGPEPEPVDVSNRYLQFFEDEIRALMQKEQSPDMGDMAEYMRNHPGVREKLVSAIWDVEFINGELYGKVTAHLREAFSDEEEEAFKDEIIGQAADGFGEGFEQRPIATEDGDLYVSLWNSGDEYFVYDESEMDEYLASLDQQMT